MTASIRLALACALMVAAVAPASASATITITAQGGEIEPEDFATTDGSDGGGFTSDPKTIPSLPGAATASVTGSPPPAAASSSIGSAHASAATTLSVSSTVSQTTGMVFRSTMSSNGAASTHRDTADSQAARRLEATASEEGGSSIQFTIDVPMDYTLSGGLTDSVDAAIPDSHEGVALRGPTGELIESAQTGQAVGGSGLLPAGHYILAGSAFMSLGAREPDAQGGSDSASGSVGFDMTFTLTPAVDSDGDGLPNSWETSGLDTDGDGIVDVDLPGMGADPNHKDIFIEIDAMAGHELGDAAVDDVVNAFARAPVPNPDGSTGIALHVDNGPGSVMDPVTGELWGSQSRHDVLAHQQVLGTLAGGIYGWSAFDAIKAAHFDPDRGSAFHYVVSAHQFGNATNDHSGISRGIGAGDLIVSLGFCVPALAADCRNTEKEEAGTLMHELGHNLGLHHGGTDDVNNKPVYLSIMNYDFQFSWLPKADGTDVLDYSRFAAGTIDEHALDENAGFGVAAGSPAAAFDTIFACPAKKVLVAMAAASRDFNCNATIDGVVAADINADGQLTPLTGSDDWPLLVYKGGGIGSLGAPATPPARNPRANRSPGPAATPTPPRRATCTLQPGSSSIALHGAKRGRLTITARCTATATLKLRAKVTSARRVHRRLHTTSVSLAAKSVHAKPNTTVTIKLTLPRRTLTALTRGDKTSATLTLQVAGATGTSTTTTRIAHLTAQRR